MTTTSEPQQRSFSPSSLKTWLTCRMKFFWSKVFDDVGLESAGGAFVFDFGTVLHEVCMRGLIEGPEVAEREGRKAEEAVRKLVEDHMMGEPLRTEYPIMARALTYAFISRVVPDLLREYRIVGTEVDVRVPVPSGSGVELTTFPDIIAEHIAQGFRVYFDLKTTGLDAQRFCKLWERDPQVQLGIWGYNELHPEDPVEGVVMVGLSKGSTYKGSLRGPFITAYATRASAGVGRERWQTGYGKGLERRLITEYPNGGIEGWVDRLDQETIAEAFPVTHPISADPDLTERYLVQGSAAAQGWKLADVAIVDRELDTSDPHFDAYFPRNTDACEDVVRGWRCQFHDACWNPVTAKDPVASGLYKLRGPEARGRMITEEG